MNVALVGIVLLLNMFSREETFTNPVLPMDRKTMRE